MHVKGTGKYVMLNCLYLMSNEESEAKKKKNECKHEATVSIKRDSW